MSNYVDHLSVLVLLKSCVAVMVGRMTRDANSSLKAYIHQHAWLQYVSFALTAAAAVYSEHSRSADAEVIDSATQLYEDTIQTAVDYFTHRAAVTDHPLGVKCSSITSVFC